jgi:methionyl-tRNA formyltransferase
MNNPSLKIIFMGTPDFSVPALQSLINHPSFEVVAVYTQPARPAGRGQQLKPSPIQMVADAHHIPVYTPKSLKRDPDAVSIFQNLNADIAVVAAYGLILPLSVLNAPKHGCLNIHASLLPRWRGAAPIQRAIEAGDTASGITIMQMAEGLDTGDMLLKESVTIEPTATAQILHDALSAIGSKMIVTVLEKVLKGEPLNPEIQDETLTNYAAMLKKEEGHIDWSDSAAKIDLKIRAFTPWPGCYTMSIDGKRIKILSGEYRNETTSKPTGTILSADGDIACGDGIYRINLLQPENSKAMDFKSALNGKKIAIGDRLS